VPQPELLKVCALKDLGSWLQIFKKKIKLAIRLILKQGGQTAAYSKVSFAADCA
jgi:hypothetical protein